MTQRARVYSGLIFLALGSLALAAPLVNVPLEWKPTSDLRLGSTQMTAATVQFEPFKDVREMPQKIGENREDDSRSRLPRRMMLGRSLVSTCVSCLRRRGSRPSTAGGDVIVKGEVRQFFVRETHTYQGEVAVHLTVVGKDGATLYSGVAPGDASRFGRSYLLENYYEVLSDALVNATSSTLQSAEFQKALSGR